MVFNIECESGTVSIKFVVEKDGSLTDIQINATKCTQLITKPEGIKALEDEALRIMSIMPKFKPSKIKKQPVRSHMIQFLSFRFG